MKALTWDDLANLYDKRGNGRKARTLPMDKVAEWAERQPDIFVGADDCFYMKHKDIEEKSLGHDEIFRQ